MQFRNKRGWMKASPGQAGWNSKSSDTNRNSLKIWVATSKGVDPPALLAVMSPLFCRLLFQPLIPVLQVKNEETQVWIMFAATKVRWPSKSSRSIEDGKNEHCRDSRYGSRSFVSGPTLPAEHPSAEKLVRLHTTLCIRDLPSFPWRMVFRSDSLTGYLCVPHSRCCSTSCLPLLSCLLALPKDPHESGFSPRAAEMSASPGVKNENQEL